MQAALLSIGDELVLGQVLDTNTAHLSAQLLQLGIAPRYHLTVPDDQAAIAEAFRQAIASCDLVIATGGLGPTADDLTRFALADALGCELVLHEPSLAHIRTFFERRGRQMPEPNRVQALFPASATVLDNEHGTAPGILVHAADTRIIVMPGVPSEMIGMFDRHVLPLLRGVAGDRFILTARLATFGIGESDVATRLGDLMDRSRNPLVGTTVSHGIVCVRIRSEFPDRARAQQQLDATIALVEQRLAPTVFGRDDQTLEHVVTTMLLAQRRTIATAESCTAGLLGQLLTETPGSSAAYLAGWITYANDAKSRDLGIDPHLIQTHGAVSQPVALAMADAARARADTDFALSITGIAGPTGSSPDKPVGTVHIALADRRRPTVAHKFIFPGDRPTIRDRSAKTALNLLRLRLLELD